MKLLRGALLANAAFSGVSGGALLVAGGVVANVLGAVPHALVRIVGAGLVGFALLVALEARSPRRGMLSGVVAADVAWVVGSALLLLARPAWLAPPGAVLLASVAAVVAALALAQGLGLRDRSA